MTNEVTKAIFPVAGLGTRFLPATKSIPKEIMTLVDKPLIEYAIEEAREAGIEEFIFVTSRGKGALEDYFDNAPILEDNLRKKGKTELLKTLQKTNMDSGAIAYIRQHLALGLGHAVWCAHRLLGDEPFAVILPDDVIAADKPCLKQMVESYQNTGGNMVATMEVPWEKTAAYGVLDVEEDMGSVVSVKSMVEKPDPKAAPSNLAVIGRYILRPSIMQRFDEIKEGRNGEIQLTDAITADAIKGVPTYGYRFRGQRFDCGSKSGFLQATVAFGLAREELSDDLRSFIYDALRLDRAGE